MPSKGENEPSQRGCGGSKRGRGVSKRGRGVSKRGRGGISKCEKMNIKEENEPSEKKKPKNGPSQKKKPKNGPSAKKKPKNEPSETKKSKADFSEYINFCSLAHSTETEEGCLEFCQSHNLLPTSATCPSCGDCLIKVHFNKSEDSSDRSHLSFVCEKEVCCLSIPLNTNTFFQRCQLSYKKTLFLMYCFISRRDYEFAMKETSGEDFGNEETCRRTVKDMYKYCRELLVEASQTDQQEKIGGPSCTVEIDEVRYGKTKFSKGRHMDGQWLLGGLCRETKEYFMIPIEDRSEETVIGLIKETVAVGSNVYTDCFESYNRLTEEGYHHVTLDRSKHFVDSQTGCHTNTLQSTWMAVKKHLKETKTKKENLAIHLVEYMWHRKHNETPCKFSALVKEIAKVFPLIKHESQDPSD